MVLASIEISDGLQCKLIEMSKESGIIEVLNPLGNPHWVIASRKVQPLYHGSNNGSSAPEALRWDRRCMSCKLRLAIERLGIHISRFWVSGGSIRMEVIATDKMHNRLLDELRRIKCGYQILNAVTLPKANGSNRPTKNQLRILRIALQEGYYDYPRGIDLRVLSGALGRSPSTLCENLRRGEKAIIGEYVARHESLAPANQVGVAQE